jgi:hypothetical protein
MPQSRVRETTAIVQCPGEGWPHRVSVAEGGRCPRGRGHRRRRQDIDVHEAAVIDVGGRTLMTSPIDAHALITGLSPMNPQKNLKLLLKDGTIDKNELAA